MEIQQPPPVIHVAVGVIRNGQGDFLLARRPEHLHQGGLWEFPGGKVETGETVEVALRRELQEELAITVGQATPLIKIRHDYGDKRVLLDVWRVETFGGKPTGQEGQAIRWIAPDQLRQFDFPAANRPIIAAARLPDFYPIVNGGASDEDALFAKLKALCLGAYPLAQWRVKGLDDTAYQRLTRRAVDYCRPHGLGLIINAEPEHALQSGAAGVHLTSQRLLALNQRPLPEGFWVAASCHHPREIHLAEAMGIDFVLLSPVLATPSHPDATPLGWDQFSAWVDSSNVPVFALGGMARAHLEQAKHCGAQGVAGIRGFGDA